MAILFNCPHCGSQTNVDDRFAGQSGPCRSCGQTITVPGTSSGGVAYAPPVPKRGSGGTLLSSRAMMWTFDATMAGPPGRKRVPVTCPVRPNLS